MSKVVELIEVEDKGCIHQDGHDWAQEDPTDHLSMLYCKHCPLLVDYDTCYIDPSCS